jgi:hypothetical protein
MVFASRPYYTTRRLRGGFLLIAALYVVDLLLAETGVWNLK